MSVNDQPPSDNGHDTETDLLSKLEIANRLLEADQKACSSLNSAPSPTPGHSRKGSGSSVQSSTSSNSHYSTQQTDEENNLSTSGNLWDVWGKLVNDWENAKKKQQYIKDLVRKGIPHHFRGLAWQLLLNVNESPHRQMYVEYLKDSSPSEKLIKRDIARTFPEQDFFKEKDGLGQESLFNVMKAYSLHDREVGYCQGSGFIVGLLLMQMPEEETFAVLVQLMQDYRLRELFKPSMAELGLCMYKLEWLIQEFLPTLYLHFQTQGFYTSMYASSWFLTLFSTTLPMSMACRVMDVFISEGMDFIFRLAIAILQTSQDVLKTMDMEGMLKFFQKEVPLKYEQEPEKLFQAAYQVRYNSKKMKKIEKDYTAQKSKENEDQIELRRLRTENRLLRQRIDTLEKESALLADKLIHDQVTRATEAEETYALKNKLSTTKQKLADTTRKLEEAHVLLDDVKQRTLSIANAGSLDDDESEIVIQGLQEELIALHLKDADTNSLVKELRSKIKDLEDTNLQLQRAPSNDIQSLQEGLIAVKLREAEANLSLKEMRQRVHELESLWAKHIESMTRDPVSPKDKKQELKQINEELMTVKIREATSLSDLKESKQKIMEFETQNHICTNQIRRMDEENKMLKSKMEERDIIEKDYKHQIQELHRKMDDLHTQRKEDSMMVRITEAEHAQYVATLKQKIAEVEIQKEELLTADRLDTKVGSQDLENRIYDLQDEVLQLKLMQKTPESERPRHNGFCGPGKDKVDDEDEEDEEDFTDLENPETLNRTLSEIVDGHDLSEEMSSQLQYNGASDTDSANLGSSATPCGIQANRQLKTEDSLQKLKSSEQSLSCDVYGTPWVPRDASDIIDVEIYKESKV
ncbi:ecotropic viral integration site 5 ortholog-like isoform X1 [Mizuhopecten yessoensis]|uniref:ecotropic viral integration site 5 ortholog-like isoform X1 n=1 Tax=Mizuhopecten yessoensis TaxID=6573 RepID=UPI000B45EDFB|nr:ecotropic viral integration site 5 ortholog-like isoform X1 [Mizuhopecten yessoensis]XP_021367678.1 ecotropic viral integration site 5 ortholog-like isoform X1 [Mizuhopecten yessoensis]XP_021367679.1 ecotropic viral integration site 5 ortholog-like isoform X1 [Mizuhopecten yessoensis]XP_021367680.1 ecotropic viral integration site 5 ortholog-like isoform X1 [Mizuhopecten yessoensis]